MISRFWSYLMALSVAGIMEMDGFDVETLVTLPGTFALSSFLLTHFFTCWCRYS